MKYYTPSILTGIALLALSPVASGVVVVQWGPDENVTGGGFGINLSPNPGDPNVIDLTDPANPDPATNGGTYYPNNTNSRTPTFFYTGVQNAGSLDARIINNTSPAVSDIRLGMRDQDGSDGYAVNGANLAIWTKDGFDYATGPDHGFLNGGDANPVTLTSLSSSWTSNGGTAAGLTTFYWVIRLGNDFYATGGDSIAQSTDLADPASANWFSYDPLTDITDVSNAGSAAPLPNLDNLTAVGVLTTFDHTSTGNIFINSSVEQVIAEGVVVPEPGVYAAIAGLGVLIFVVRRRKRLA